MSVRKSFSWVGTFLAFILGMAVLTALGQSASAQFWTDDNKLTRQIVYATCGEPQIPVTDTCICGDLLGYNTDATAGLDERCNGRWVPNIIHPDMTTPRMLRFLVTAYYGLDVVDFCKAANPDGTCSQKVSVNGIGGTDDEAYFVGHFTSALLGQQNCLDASLRKPAEEWASGPAIGEMDLSGMTDTALREAFQQGCRNDYRNVLLWLESQ
ncbi:hypothetical protein [Ruegeria sp. HKCCD7318]|uniref:hypothetical protein n=1 Tax=Ruegeria sp. HKCCD7318 TaxID=2683014 RepID=UPI001490E7C5|nr:hypothetical protein [Ruegeria sp. HKCCD7318]NOE36229.1 hypothetical protein [Ruegeria sp. HKCCD7318]